MNHAARTTTVEVLMNETEVAGLDAIRGSLGRSPFLRSLVDAAAKATSTVRTHGTGQPACRESRQCPGLGRQACRPRGAKGGARRNL
ncbi:hypothetical protein [Massilia phyllosphaerae]|jgi:hypothetical protein|uniref:hypothetical protein n=1 Tax=Massilia phyllosphaerae TaxID=3106034 RepID=UPI002B1CBEE1|nr:hypothetical protein [Massilia sp. SGZ-792]